LIVVVVVVDVVVVGATVVVVAVVVVGATVVVVVVVGLAVVVVVRDVDLGTQIRFLPTKTQTCAAPPMVRTAPTREHLPDAAPVGKAVWGTITDAPTNTAIMGSRCLRFIGMPAPGPR
jgi:hypothetical protein